jgi:hypothetical protein
MSTQIAAATTDIRGVHSFIVTVIEVIASAVRGTQRKQLKDVTG